MRRRGIDFRPVAASKLVAAENRVELADGSTVDYDFLIIATGPELAFDEIEGLGPDGYTQSVCHIDHAEKAYVAFEEFCKDPGPIVVGAVQGASCFGPGLRVSVHPRNRASAPPHPRQGADDLRHFGALCRPSRTRWGRRYQGPARIQYARQAHQVDDLVKDRQGRAGQAPCRADQRRRQLQGRDRGAGQVRDDAARLPGHQAAAAATRVWSIRAASSSSTSTSRTRNSRTSSRSASASPFRRSARLRCRAACPRPAS